MSTNETAVIRIQTYARTHARKQGGCYGLHIYSRVSSR